MAAPLLLDTCALIWLANGDPIAEEAAAALAAEAQAGRPVAVSPISAWEIGILVARQKLVLALSPSAWFQRVAATPGVEVVPLAPEILIASCALPGFAPRDPADRMLAATARERGYRLVTRDKVLAGYAAAGYLAVVAC